MPTQLRTSRSVRTSLRRQVIHWRQAASRLASLEHLASGTAWHGIDHQMGVLLRASLQRSIDTVLESAQRVSRDLDSASDDAALRRVKREVTLLRDVYLKAEETIHFYTDAVNSRTTASVAALLRACDILCVRSMQQVLQPLGRSTPTVLTYIDKGVGASILKAGLRLWDGNVSSVAAIKVTQHNLFRPTAIIHETGHQVAHTLDWNDELARALAAGLSRDPVVASAFASWSSEIAADAFAFVHTGYAAVAALHDVVSGPPQSVFAYRVHDPHPISYIRVLLGTAMCRQFYGSGPWDEMDIAFRNDYDLELVGFPSVGLIRKCIPLLPDVVRIVLQNSYRAFHGRSLAALLDPAAVSPAALQKLEYIAGPSLFTSHAWVWKECIKLLALNGYKIALGEGDIAAQYTTQAAWMTRLGFAVEVN
ncbi:MAG: hypothetical protein HY962_08220 [Ignavibacteriae bacterium]|nr:hypothetical protein [Ignavibacteriota bacterium]